MISALQYVYGASDGYRECSRLGSKYAQDCYEVIGLVSFLAIKGLYHDINRSIYSDTELIRDFMHDLGICSSMIDEIC